MEFYMNLAQKNIIEAYTGLFEGLSALSKIELIEKLSKLLKKEEKSKDDTFFKSFGAFASDKSAEDISQEIRASRKFRDKEINF